LPPLSAAVGWDDPPRVSVAPDSCVERREAIGRGSPNSTGAATLCRIDRGYAPGEMQHDVHAPPSAARLPARAVRR